MILFNASSISFTSINVAWNMISDKSYVQFMLDVNNKYGDCIPVREVT